MIRLCDKEVYAADIRDVTRGELIGRFCAAEGEKPLCFLYDGEEEAGYISYDILFKNPNKEIEECMETAFITVGEDMFVQARKFFSEYPEKHGFWSEMRMGHLNVLPITIMKKDMMKLKVSFR